MRIILSLTIACLTAFGPYPGASAQTGPAKQTPAPRHRKTENLVELKARSENDIFSRTGKASRTPAYAEEGYWVWGSSVVRGDDGKYHMFVSRWVDSLPFHPGWLVASEIVHAVSDVPEGPYRFSDVALPARGAQYWDGRATHNPRILRHGGKYYLVYMGTTHPFADPPAPQLQARFENPWYTAAKSNKRTGLAVADSPYGPWERFDKPILDAKPGTFYSYLASNPSPVIHPDGSVLMIFKGRGHNGVKDTRQALGMASATSIYGPYTVLNDDKPIFSDKQMGEVDDPFLWYDEDGYHVVFKDMGARYTPEHHGGVLAHSKDGLNWTVDPDPKAYSRTVEWEDGTTQMLGQCERVFLLLDGRNRPTHMFFGTMDGPGGFNNATRSWNMVIPLDRKTVAPATK